MLLVSAILNTRYLYRVQTRNFTSFLFLLPSHLRPRPSLTLRSQSLLSPSLYLSSPPRSPPSRTHKIPSAPPPPASRPTPSSLSSSHHHCLCPGPHQSRPLPLVSAQIPSAAPFLISSYPFESRPSETSRRPTPRCHMVRRFGSPTSSRGGGAKWA